MRSDESNPLDLNNLPEEYGRDLGKQVVFELESSLATTDASDTTRFSSRKKRSGGGGKDGKDECGKEYECRFCSLKFCKSQALGGHMNRHRQERETETLNRARQLVFSNESIAAQGCPHLGSRDSNLSGARTIPSVNFNHQAGSNTGDPSHQPPFRPIYPTRLFSGSSSTILSAPPPPPHQPYRLYSSSLSSSPSSRLVLPFPSQYPPHHQMNDYLINGVSESNYTCIGAPLGHVFPHDADKASRILCLSPSTGRGGGALSLQSHQEDNEQNWGPSYGRTEQLLDPSSINRFQDGF